MLRLKDLRQISVIGLGLLGSSVTLAVSRALPRVRSVGYSHREYTRQKALEMGVVDRVKDNLADSVRNSDLVILATPIFTFKDIFAEIKGSLKDSCIVTDVGSTKVLPHKWAKQVFGVEIRYVGSHPIAGSEKRGVEYGRDDLFAGANCILTQRSDTSVEAVEILKDFWSKLGAFVKIMSPVEHDRIFGRVSHLPHLTAAALMNATCKKDVCYAGKGFIDTTRVASGPSNIWADILLANGVNTTKGVDKLIGELEKIKEAILNNDEKALTRLLDGARNKRSELIEMKIANGEII